MPMIKDLVRLVRLVGGLLIPFGADTSIGANLCAE